MGRNARRTYELSEINIVPSRRTRSSQDVSTAWQLDAYRFEIPVLAHPTDALVSPEFAIELGRLGGLAVLNGEGLIGRHSDVPAKITQLLEAASKEPEPSAAIRLLQELHAAPLNPDLLGAAVARIREAGVTTAVRVSPQNAQALTPVLVQAGIDLLMIQGTIVSAERVARDGEPLNLKSFISELDVPVVAGGVQDHRTALHLMRTGAAGVIVGYGATRGVTTTDEVLGISVPMATAIADAAAARREYLDETGGATCMCWPTATSTPPASWPRRSPAGLMRWCWVRRWPRPPKPWARAGSGRRPPRIRRCRAARCCRSPSANAPRWSGSSTAHPTTRSAP